MCISTNKENCGDKHKEILTHFWKKKDFNLTFQLLILHLISVVTQRFITSEEVCWNIRNVKFKFFFFPEMRLCFFMFITAVCFLFFHFEDTMVQHF